MWGVPRPRAHQVPREADVRAAARRVGGVEVPRVQDVRGVPGGRHQDPTRHVRRVRKGVAHRVPAAAARPAQVVAEPRVQVPRLRGVQLVRHDAPEGRLVQGVRDVHAVRPQVCAEAVLPDLHARVQQQGHEHDPVRLVPGAHWDASRTQRGRRRAPPPPRPADPAPPSHPTVLDPLALRQVHLGRRRVVGRSGRVLVPQLPRRAHDAPLHPGAGAPSEGGPRRLLRRARLRRVRAAHQLPLGGAGPDGLPDDARQDLARRVT